MLSYYHMEELLRTSHSLCVLALSWAAAAGINATTAAPGSKCWLLQREEILLRCEIHVPISEKTHVLAPPPSIRPGALSLLSGWSFSTGTWTDHIPARALISFVMEELKALLEKVFLLKWKTQIMYFSVRRLRRNIAKKSHRALLSPFFFQESILNSCLWTCWEREIYQRVLFFLNDGDITSNKLIFLHISPVSCQPWYC